MAKSLRTLTFLMVTALPGLALAHGVPPAPTHGGRVLEANENWIELVLAGNRARVFVLDEHREPIPAAKMAGQVTIMAGGKPRKVILSQGPANELDAALPLAAGAEDAAIVSLTIEGQRAPARYPAGR